MKKRSVAILVYDSVEVLDFAGPFEVFAVTDELNDGRYFDVALVAADDVDDLSAVSQAELDIVARKLN